MGRTVEETPVAASQLGCNYLGVKFDFENSNLSLSTRRVSFKEVSRQVQMAARAWFNDNKCGQASSVPFLSYYYCSWRTGPKLHPRISIVYGLRLCTHLI